MARVGVEEARRAGRAAEKRPTRSARGRGGSQADQPSKDLIAMTRPGAVLAGPALYRSEDFDVGASGEPVASEVHCARSYAPCGCPASGTPEYLAPPGWRYGRA